MTDYPVRTLVAGIAFLIAIIMAGQVFMPDKLFFHLPFHSAIEALGALSAFILAFLIIYTYKQQEQERYFIWIPGALLGMGVLDLFHSFVTPAASFVWLHSTATFTGGLLFAMVWLPGRISQSISLAALSKTILIASGLFGLFFMVNPRFIPPMVDQGGFTSTAKALNLLGGVLFILAAARFFSQYRRSGALAEILFANHCLLFGIAGILFDFSKLWDWQWWLWHLIRLLAYFVALLYVFVLCRQAQEALHRAHGDLERRVEARTAELQMINAQLLHAEKLSAIGKLAASIAHEFNNPLLGIQNVLAGLKRRVALGEEDLELTDMALQECERIRSLIQDLKDFNRPSSAVMAPIDLHKTIENMLRLLQKELQNKKIKVIRQFDPKMPMIAAVGDQIKQVLLNLFNNANEAIREAGGTITITTALLADEQVAVRIQDSGGGIKPADLPRIFEPFFSTKPEVKGTGLGLSISYGIIKSHGGKIDVESEPGHGSTFTIFLPIEGNF